MGEPKGFLITWTCYGTWLWGDPRGSVDRQHNVFGTPDLTPSSRRVAVIERRMKHTPYTLTDAGRNVVHQAIEDHCRFRGWELVAVNARSNHVHMVVRFAGLAPEPMMGECKGWACRRLRVRGFAHREHPVWTKGGSTRYLWKESDLEPATRYVLEGQVPERFEGRAGQPDHPAQTR